MTDDLARCQAAGQFVPCFMGRGAIMATLTKEDFQGLFGKLDRFLSTARKLGYCAEIEKGARLLYKEICRQLSADKNENMQNELSPRAGLLWSHFEAYICT